MSQRPDDSSSFAREIRDMITLVRSIACIGVVVMTATFVIMIHLHQYGAAICVLIGDAGALFSFIWSYHMMSRMVIREFLDRDEQL